MNKQEELKKLIEYCEDVTIRQIHFRFVEGADQPLEFAEHMPSMEKLFAAEPRLGAIGSDYLGLPEEVLNMDITTKLPGEGDDLAEICHDVGDMAPKKPDILIVTGVVCAVGTSEEVQARLKPLMDAIVQVRPLMAETICRCAFARRAAKILRRAYQDMYGEDFKRNEPQPSQDKAEEEEEGAPPAQE
ncbi:hypothetical protein KR026_011396 [Drosophila bipectinata]|nr:hypothetical protein KR026_011396 [Drosophila bipectinata]